MRTCVRAAAAPACMRRVAADASRRAESGQRAGSKLGALSWAAAKPQGSSNTRERLSTASASSGCLQALAPTRPARNLWPEGVLQGAARKEAACATTPAHRRRPAGARSRPWCWTRAAARGRPRAAARPRPPPRRPARRRSGPRAAPWAAPARAAGRRRAVSTQWVACWGSAHAHAHGEAIMGFNGWSI